jgi:NADH:ubiquinone oxidoreductase subunit 5 (subunit L)/multisubunit Na+/H+ antiporter MnhA subunit
MKAMIVNRIGDVGVVIAIIYSYYIFGSVNYDIIFFISEDGDVDFIAAMLLVGAIGKSAQLGLHT